jgi:hypothetical protein
MALEHDAVRVRHLIGTQRSEYPHVDVRSVFPKGVVIEGLVSDDSKLARLKEMVQTAGCTRVIYAVEVGRNDRP